MNKVAGFLTLCLVVAMLRAMVVALVAALMLALLWSFIRQPRETILFTATCALSCVAVGQPIACVVGVTVVAIVTVLAGRTRKRGDALLLTGTGESH